MNITCRSATPSDLAALTSFNLALAQETENLTLHLATVQAGVERLLARPQYGFYVVAESAGQVIGSLLVTYEWTDWRDGLFWWIQSVYVQPEFRGRGVYRQLHGYIHALARADADVRGLRLYVENENRTAQQAYKKMGMTQAAYQIYEAVFGGR